MASSTIGMLRTAVPSAAPSSKQKGPAAMTVECSSRPQKKATAHHMKTRPKKTQPWDVKRRGPTAYPPLPSLPPDWTLVSPGAQEEQQQQDAEEAAESVAEVVAV